MGLVDSTQAVIDKGLEGDRYYTNSGYWHQVEACQVTLISEQRRNKLFSVSDDEKRGQ